MDVDTQQQLIDLGITSPVTRQSAGQSARWPVAVLILVIV
jgi:hypothetical protein